jgi:thioredoxin-like negative regulator of GroEL
MLERSVYSQDSFKAMGKYFVFVKINVDQQPGVSQRYGVRALPTLKFMKPDGALVHEFVGGRPLQQFLAEMETARRAGGL